MVHTSSLPPFATSFLKSQTLKQKQVLQKASQELTAAKELRKELEAVKRENTALRERLQAAERGGARSPTFRFSIGQHREGSTGTRNRSASPPDPQRQNYRATPFRPSNVAGAQPQHPLASVRSEDIGNSGAARIQEYAFRPSSASTRPYSRSVGGTAAGPPTSVETVLRQPPLHHGRSPHRAATAQGPDRPSGTSHGITAIRSMPMPPPPLPSSSYRNHRAASTAGPHPSSDATLRTVPSSHRQAFRPPFLSRGSGSNQNCDVDRGPFQPASSLVSLSRPLSSRDAASDRSHHHRYRGPGGL
ncbi:hypothetical protein ACQY0O_001871 [Thecaphora frezii]